MMPQSMVPKEATDPMGLQHIAPGETRTEHYLMSAPGIDQLEYSWRDTPDKWEKTGAFHQTGAGLAFFKPGEKKGIWRNFQISQAVVGQDQKLTFLYDGNKEAKIDVKVESEDNIWEGSGFTSYSWNAKYYDYTIILTQTEPEQGTLK